MNQRLFDMLSVKRPHNSVAEKCWITRFIMPYSPIVLGNGKSEPMVFIVQVQNEDGSDPTVLFSAHTDTVHRTEGFQEVLYGAKTSMFSKTDGEALGADDAAGVWLMLEMIDAAISGCYTFPRGEEVGGIGSGWLAENQAKWLKTFDYAIAFDRRATHSIITHQSRGMCASDAFAQTLANKLNDLNDDFMYAPDDTGMYTDTAEYVDLIAECTNISVGYYDEHSGRERLDEKHLLALRDACLKLDWASLPVVRKPGEDDWIPTAIKSSRYATSTITDCFSMTRKEMIEWAEYDPVGFVDSLRIDLRLEEDDEEDDRNWNKSSRGKYENYTN